MYEENNNNNKTKKERTENCILCEIINMYNTEREERNKTGVSTPRYVSTDFY